MIQVIQYSRERTPAAVTVPDPATLPGMLLIQSRASLISPGTERASVQMARSSLLSMARRRPDLAREVWQKMRIAGLSQTIHRVRDRLAKPFTPGYSSAGIVIGVGDGVTGFQIGDRVAAAGQDYASHAEIVSVPKNLVCMLPRPVQYAEGAFAAVGAVALQAVRTADVRIGETIAVIGLGLLGQLTAQILSSHGCRVLGIDPDCQRRTAAQCLARAVAVVPEDAARIISEMSDGRGADSVIICAASESSSIIEQAAELARDRAVIVVVGSFPLQLPRTPFYRKELQLRFSRSYGPGRYDPLYEERGIDYPIGYVRWTENRNMEAFLELVAERRVDVLPLITHRFDPHDCQQAYETVEHAADSLAVLFEYAGAADPAPVVRRFTAKPRIVRNGTLGVGFWGAGRFAGGVLIPIFAGRRDARLTGVASRTPVSAEKAMRQHGFAYATCRGEELLADADIHIVVIATPHSQHARQAEAALRAGKHVFLEKPAATNRDDLRHLYETVLEVGGYLQVGFNRRFSPAVQSVKTALASVHGPKTIIYRVAAGPRPKDGWLSDPQEGGRLIGEIGHFADTILCLSESWPRNVFARHIGAPGGDGVEILIAMMDGSVGTIVYSTDAHSRTPKEYVEIHAGGVSATVSDFSSWTISTHRGQLKHRGAQDKGHRAQIEALLTAIRSDGVVAGDVTAALCATEITFAAAESLRTGLPVEIQPWI